MSRVLIHGRLDEPLSRWLWLVKWILLIPHFIVLLFLWLGAAFVTLIAFFAILFTGRYPESLFAYVAGVLRWSWRVQYYGYGALATDRYPPFTLAEVPDYPTRLTIARPERLHRLLPLVKWLLAIPHLLLIAAISGGIRWTYNASGETTNTTAISLLTVASLIVGFALLFTGRYPRGLFDLMLGIGRWGYRVATYLLLLTDTYPPFRLDQGGDEPPEEV